MRLMPLIVLLSLPACSNEANHLGNPLLLPLSGLSTVIENATYNKRRGRVEVIVKSNHPTLIAEISAGGGPVLTEAMDAARIPNADRPARVTQMQGDLGLYNSNLEALIVALMVYGN